MYDPESSEEVVTGRPQDRVPGAQATWEPRHRGQKRPPRKVKLLRVLASSNLWKLSGGVEEGDF